MYINMPIWCICINGLKGSFISNRRRKKPRNRIVNIRYCQTTTYYSALENAIGSMDDIMMLGLLQTGRVIYNTSSWLCPVMTKISSRKCSQDHYLYTSNLYQHRLAAYIGTGTGEGWFFPMSRVDMQETNRQHISESH